MAIWNIASPIDDRFRKKLCAGDSLSLSGVIYTARDAAHKKLADALKSGNPLPFDVKGQTIYYMGPTPARPGRSSAPAGPPPVAAWTLSPLSCCPPGWEL